MTDFFNILPLGSMVFVGIATAITAVAGATVTFVGAQKAASAAEDAGRAQKQAADAAARNAELEQAEGIKRARINKRRSLARMRASRATSGLTMADSSLDIFAETAGIMELGILDAARSGNINTANMRDQGNLSLWESRLAAAGTRMSSYGTLLTNASSAAGNYYATRPS